MRKQGVYDLILAAFCGLLLISNIGATKLIAFGSDLSIGQLQIFPLIVDGGAFLFPLTYILGDVLAEVYGFRRANRAIFIAFGLSILASLTFFVVDLAPAATDWPLQNAWHQVLGFVPRIVVASLLGYICGQVLNAWVLVRIKKRFGERRLWVRLVSSTIMGELVDTTLFCLVAFGPVGTIFGGGFISWDALLNYILVGWIYKTLVEVLLLPITYRVIAKVKRMEHLATQ